MVNLQDIEFRSVSFSEGDQFISLMNKTYTRKKTLEYFKWQFFDSPLKTVLMGAFLNYRLIGCFGLQCRKLNNGLIGGQAIDLIIDNEFRGRGIFPILGKNALDFFKKDLDFGFVLPNIAGKKACEESLSWKNILTIKTMMLMKFHSQYNNSRVRITENWDDFAFEDNRKGSTEFLYFLRGKDELKWRFGENPEYKYSVVRMDDSFAIVKVFVDPITKEYFGDIVDFGYDMENISLIKKLFCSVVDYFRRRDIKKITVWAIPNTFLHEILEKIEFIESKQERYFCVKSFKSDYKYLHNAENWLLVEGDAEIY